MLGSVLPTRKSIAMTDRWYAELQVKKRNFVQTNRELRLCEHRFEQGEDRYYENETVFAVVNNSLRAIWFEWRVERGERVMYALKGKKC